MDAETLRIVELYGPIVAIALVIVGVGVIDLVSRRPRLPPIRWEARPPIGSAEAARLAEAWRKNEREAFVPLSEVPRQLKVDLFAGMYKRKPRPKRRRPLRRARRAPTLSGWIRKPAARIAIGEHGVGGRTRDDTTVTFAPGSLTVEFG